MELSEAKLQLIFEADRRDPAIEVEKIASFTWPFGEIDLLRG